MNFKQKISETLGNKVLDIETINRKDALPASVQEIRARRERAEVLVRKKRCYLQVQPLCPYRDLILGWT